MTTTPHHDDHHENDQMLSIEEAATFLRVPVATMRYWRYCGTGPSASKSPATSATGIPTSSCGEPNRDADPTRDLHSRCLGE